MRIPNWKSTSTRPITHPDATPNDEAPELLGQNEGGDDANSSRGPMGSVIWKNVLILGLIILISIALSIPLVGLPVSSYFSSGDAWYTDAAAVGFNTSQGSGSGKISGSATLIDSDTPQFVFTRTGSDGYEYDLVFSDEFNTDNRTFYPGDDPYWEAVDLHYEQGNDLEWFDPAAVTTRNGSLVITLDTTSEHGFGYRSGMLQSWNKFCFTGAYVEVSALFPGDQISQGYWPAAWAIGNLARPGYGASMDGVWPYSYNSCDVGTLPNQTMSDGTPAIAQTSGGTATHGILSYLPGQRVSACTCPGEDHPGPNVGIGRGAPEIDIFAAEHSLTGGGGSQVSQSYAFAPFTAGYQYPQGFTTVSNTAQTVMSHFNGSATRQSIGALTNVDATSFEHGPQPAYSAYGVECKQDSSIVWMAGGQQAWSLAAGALAGDAQTEISQRLISEEPMAMVFHLAMSESWQSVDLSSLVFPATLKIDYVRVYQRKGQTNIGCDPTDRPTADYIQKHLNAYQNPNMTTWDQAGYSFPKNSLRQGC